MANCAHLDTIEFTDPPPSIPGCEECLKIGSRWVHLRMCQECGKIGCCDNSPNRHATAHFHESGHPIIRSVEPGEDWSWCYVDELMFRLRALVSPVRPPFPVVGRRLEPEHHRLRDFLTRTAQPFDWLEAGTPEAQELLAAHGLSEADLPVVIEPDAVTTRATVERLVDAWGYDSAPKRSHYDLVIVGAGPAGLGAAVYAASDGLTTVVIEEDVPGGQASHTSAIENFFGFPDGIGGAELARLAGRQAEKFGAELIFLRAVTGSHIAEDGAFVIEIAGGYEVQASVVIAAPGMVWRRLEIEGLDDLFGRGVYYGAGRSEAAQCSGDPVVVVGAGNSAGQAVMDLGNAGARVTMVVRGDDLGKSMSAYLVNRINEHPLIEVRLRSEVVAVAESGAVLAGVTIRDGDGKLEEIPARALFICIGGQPRTGWAENSGVRLDRAGYVLTGPDLLVDGQRPEGWTLERDPLAVETSVPGLFAAGDVRHGSIKRVGGAVGDGAMAAALVHRRLEEIRRAGMSEDAAMDLALEAQRWARRGSR